MTPKMDPYPLLVAIIQLALGLLAMALVGALLAELFYKLPRKDKLK